MVVLPTGRFRMGSPATKDRYDIEEPVHTVTISRAIAMGKYAITFEEYDRYVSAMGGERPDDCGWGRGRRPVINVSWHDAKAYALWLSEQTGKAYRLPSESEWEYGARAVLEQLLEAAYTSGRDKTRALQRASQRLNAVRHLWRLSHALKAVSPRKLPLI